MESYLNELWAAIEGTTYYSVSDLGRVRNDRTGLILKPQRTPSGYAIVRIARHGRVVNCKIHRLVTEAFITQTQNYDEVNHIDGDKLNNEVENLEWISRKGNVQHMYDEGLRKKRGVRIIETGETFSSLAECAEAINGFASAIGSVLDGRGRAKRHRGYSFEEV